MSIDSRNRKILWARSGNLCSICKKKLVVELPSSERDSIIGEECHIISGREFGPRSDPSYDRNLIDSYENLILLCAVHHKIIDDQGGAYSIEKLRKIKSEHEKWVMEKLSEEEGRKIEEVKLERIKKNIPEHLVRIETGKELLEIVKGAHG